MAGWAGKGSSQGSYATGGVWTLSTQCNLPRVVHYCFALNWDFFTCVGNAGQINHNTGHIYSELENVTDMTDISV